MPLNHVVPSGNSVARVSPFGSEAMTFGDFTDSLSASTTTFSAGGVGGASVHNCTSAAVFRYGSDRQGALELRPDAQRVAVTAPAPGTKRDRVTSILNFFDELRRLAPAGRG